jgi:hypothetical protein
VVVRKANNHVVEGPGGSGSGNAVAGNFHLAALWERLSTFISTCGDTGSFDSASASLCEAAATLRMTLYFVPCSDRLLEALEDALGVDDWVIRDMHFSVCE